MTGFYLYLALDTSLDIAPYAIVAFFIYLCLTTFKSYKHANDFREEHHFHGTWITWEANRLFSVSVSYSHSVNVHFTQTSHMHFYNLIIDVPTLDAYRILKFRWFLIVDCANICLQKIYHKLKNIVMKSLWNLWFLWIFEKFPQMPPHNCSKMKMLAHRWKAS